MGRAARQHWADARAQNWCHFGGWRCASHGI